jgi:radical SAM superfamily enzyme YgiQ (UPF0313 family)
MRVLLVHPEFPRTYWGLQHALALTGKRASLPPLGLVTVAAHLPADWELRLVDLNVAALREADLGWADLVLTGGMLVQSGSIHDVLARARAAGKTTVLGGPAPSTSPDEFPEADVVFCGELEGREDALRTAIERAGRGRQLVTSDPQHKPDLQNDPLPRFDLLDLGSYASMSVQISRGCPFRCEFCDVIEIFGRTPRVKPAERVLAELEALYRQGYRGTVFVVDDNFIGNLREVRRLLPQLRSWQDERGFPFELYTEASLNLASEPEVMKDMVAAGFSSVFVGIETTSVEALRAANKSQNLKLDPIAAVDALTRSGLEVMAGFIVGFDSDGPEAFEAQRRFLGAVPIPLAMVGLLTALPGTALARRLAAEGRLRLRSTGDTFARPNFEPRMDEAGLLSGYAALLRRLYDPDQYVRRCETYLARAPLPAHSARHDPEGIAILWRAVRALGIAGTWRRPFWRLVGAALRRSPRFVGWAITKAVQGEHFRRYTEEDVLPRLRAALEEVGGEAAAGTCRGPVDAVRPGVRRAIWSGAHPDAA